MQGVRVGEHWKDRLDCRQWGAHFPHVAGIAGQSNTGAQSVVLSGGCASASDSPLACTPGVLNEHWGKADDNPRPTQLAELSGRRHHYWAAVRSASARRYEDDRDEGEWFLYTGSGGRDLSGNKRVTNVQSFDQEFTKMNQALLVSCKKGLPVRVVRSFKARC